jgi:hypothetical protein
MTRGTLSLKGNSRYRACFFYGNNPPSPALTGATSSVHNSRLLSLPFAILLCSQSLRLALSATSGARLRLLWEKEALFLRRFAAPPLGKGGFNPPPLCGTLPVGVSKKVRLFGAKARAVIMRSKGKKKYRPPPATVVISPQRTYCLSFLPNDAGEATHYGLLSV